VKIKIEPFLMKKGNRVAKAAIEFEEGFLKGFHLVGFTICDDEEKGLFVLFPAATINNERRPESNRVFFFLRPQENDKHESQLDELETLILDTYESMISFNSPKPAKEK
jgi:hypothetical protein